MISIRGSISEDIIQDALKLHTDFITKEVIKRIDFYINLFEYLSYLQLHPKTRTETIKNRVCKIIHHTQYDSFIKIIFINEKKINYDNLKKHSLFKLNAGNIIDVITTLKKLKKKHKTIINLDLSYKGLANKSYYRLATLLPMTS